VNDKGVEREMRIVRDFFGSAETHPEQQANKQQYDIVHGMISARLAVPDAAIGNEARDGAGWAFKNS
jgi:hypothetical protein